MKRPILFLLLFAALTLLLVVSKERPPETAPQRPALVLAFGDSLTYGTGAERHLSYPSMLQRMAGVKVVNAGYPGETSDRGLKRLPDLLQQHRPDLVVLCHGGNDILRGLPKEALQANLTAMVKISKEAGADVLVVGIPNATTLGFTALPLYEAVADTQKTLYEGSIIGEIMRDARLKSDRIHPNAEGYRMMAEAFYEVLKENGKL